MIMIPEYLKLEITRDCNLECEHCYKGDKEEKYMSLETIDKAFKDISSINCLMIVGGESFLAIEQLERICEQIIKNNIDIQVMVIKTNCTILNDRVVEVLARLKREVNYLYVTTKSDAFRRMNIISKGMKKEADAVATYLVENDYLRVMNANHTMHKIYNTGRAANLTEEDIKRANENKSGSAVCMLADDRRYYDSRGRYNSPYSNEDTIYRTIYVTVDGNLCNMTPNRHTYAQIDSMVECNINDYDNILDAINDVNLKLTKILLEEEKVPEYRERFLKEYNKLKALKKR